MIIHKLRINISYICITVLIVPHIYYVTNCPTFRGRIIVPQRRERGDIVKEKVVYSLDLTIKNNTQTGFKCRHEDVGCREVSKAVKALLESLRRKARAKGREWEYCVYGVVSNVSVSRCRVSSFHAHLLFYGSPCSAIVKEAKAYWTAHHYGNAPQQSLKRCIDYGKVDYVLKHTRAAKDFGLQKQEFVQFVGNVGAGSKEEAFELFGKVLPEVAVVYPYESWKERFVSC